MMRAEVPSSAKEGAHESVVSGKRSQEASPHQLSGVSPPLHCARVCTPVLLSLPCSLCLSQYSGFFLIPFPPLTHRSLSTSFFLQTCLSRLLKDRTDKRTVPDQEWCHLLLKPQSDNNKWYLPKSYKHTNCSLLRCLVMSFSMNGLFQWQTEREEEKQTVYSRKIEPGIPAEAVKTEDIS